MTSVLFIFHVFSLHSAVDGALAAPPPYLVFLHETHTQPHMRTNTCARIEACAHKELCDSKLPFQLRLFMTCKYQRQAGAPITLPWKPFHCVCVQNRMADFDWEEIHTFCHSGFCHFSVFLLLGFYTGTLTLNIIICSM